MASEDKPSVPRLVFLKTKEYGAAAIRRYKKFSIYQKVRCPMRLVGYSFMADVGVALCMGHRLPVHLPGDILHSNWPRPDRAGPLQLRTEDQPLPLRLAHNDSSIL